MASEMIEWRPVPEWPEYEVSSEGQVRRVAPGPGTRAGRLMKPQLDTNGRPAVVLKVGARRSQMRVSRLVLLAFIGPPPTPKHEGAHENRRRTDNRISNLSWKTNL